MEICLLCVLLGIGLSNELITRPEESYRLWCVVVCDLETSRMRRPSPALGCSTIKKKKPYSFEGSNFKGIPCSGTASAECVLINCIDVCIACLIRIWCSDCAVRNKFSYYSSLSCYNRYYVSGTQMNLLVLHFTLYLLQGCAPEIMNSTTSCFT
jgi:hypothetical protein